MKKFKHKDVGVIAHQTGSTNYNLFHPDGERWLGMAPAWYIEDHKDWQEVTKEPILTTEDGVELFYKDKYFYIPKNNLNIIHDAVCQGDPEPNAFYFSTREAAETYRLNNVRVLSLKDVDANLKGITTNRSAIMQGLKLLVKPRL